MRCLMWTATLSRNEAAAAIRAHKIYNKNPWSACEAVAHYCGKESTDVLMAHAFRMRKYAL